ncbi:MAG: GDSL-type esterase/lipase family protein [Clostridia bacterium]
MDYREISNNSVIMTAGDSVTDCGRGRPYGTYRIGGLGNGYPQRLHEIITSIYPEKMIKFVNSGISGETSRQLREHWISDIEQVKPDYATIMIGVNDVWRNSDAYLDPEVGVHIDEYERNLRFVLDNSKQLKGLLLISPVFFELNKKDPFMIDIAECSAVCQKLAAEYHVGFCDIQPEIDRIISHVYTSTFSPDRVHPGAVAHFLIARAILKYVNFQF